MRVAAAHAPLLRRVVLLAVFVRVRPHPKMHRLYDAFNAEVQVTVPFLLPPTVYPQFFGPTFYNCVVGLRAYQQTPSVTRAVNKQQVVCRQDSLGVVRTPQLNLLQQLAVYPGEQPSAGTQPVYDGVKLVVADLLLNAGNVGKKVGDIH